MAGPEGAQRKSRERLQELVKGGFTLLLRNHPLNNPNRRIHVPCVAPHDLTSVEGRRIRAGEAAISNQCAIRFVDMCVKSGIPLDTSKVLCCGIKGHDHHVVRARDAAQLFEKAVRAGDVPGFERMVVLKGQQITDFFSRPQPPGAVCVLNYWQRGGEQGRAGSHIDLWNGYRTPAKGKGSFFAWLGARTNYAHAEEVWYWKNTQPQPTSIQKSHHDAPVDDPLVEGISFAAGGVAAVVPEKKSDPEKDAHDRRSFLKRAGALGVMGYASSLLFPQHPHAKTPEQNGNLIARLRAFENSLSTLPQVRLNKIFSDVHIPRLEDLSEKDRTALFGNVALGYLSEDQAKSTGKISFPIAPIRAPLRSTFSASADLPSEKELTEEPLKQIFDGAYTSWFGIRTGTSRMLTPALWVDAATGGIDKVNAHLSSGYGSVTYGQEFAREYAQTGIISFNEDLARTAHKKWASLAWLQNPDIVENGLADNNPMRQWKPQMTGGFAYDLTQTPDLAAIIEAALRETEKTDGDLAKKQCAMIRASLGNMHALVLGSQDIPHFDNVMQFVSGAAVTRASEAGETAIIGQAHWVIPVSVNGKQRLVMLYTNPDATKKATSNNQ